MFRHGVDLGATLSHVLVIPMPIELTVMRPRRSNRRSSACSERPSRKWSYLGFGYPHIKGSNVVAYLDEQASIKSFGPGIFEPLSKIGAVSFILFLGRLNFR